MKSKKQTSARVSSAAGRLLRRLGKRNRVYLQLVNEWGQTHLMDITRSVRSVCASALVQDETREQVKKTRGRK